MNGSFESVDSADDESVVGRNADEVPDKSPVPVREETVATKKPRNKVSPLSRLSRRKATGAHFRWKNSDKYALIRKIESGVPRTSLQTKYGFSKQTSSDIMYN